MPVTTGSEQNTELLWFCSFCGGGVVVFDWVWCCQRSPPQHVASQSALRVPVLSRETHTKTRQRQELDRAVRCGKGRN